MTAAPLLTRLILQLVRFSPGPRWLAGAFVAHPLNAISVLFVLVQIEAPKLSSPASAILPLVGAWFVPCLSSVALRLHASRHHQVLLPF